MVKTRKSAVETIGDRSLWFKGGESGKNAIEEETSPKTEEADEDEVSSPDENWQETPRRSTRCSTSGGRLSVLMTFGVAQEAA